jgi:hypothetical protein
MITCFAVRGKSGGRRDRVDTERLKLARAGRRQTGEMSDPVSGFAGRASIPKLAVAGRAALFAGFGVRQLDHVQTLAHRGKASRQLGQSRRHRVGHMDPSKEFRPTDAGGSAHVGGVHAERDAGNANSADDDFRTIRPTRPITPRSLRVVVRSFTSAGIIPSSILHPPSSIHDESE